MTTRYYTGGATRVAQVNTVTPGGTIAATDTFTVTMGSKDITYTATGATVAEITAGVVALVAASAEPEWQEVTAADIGTALTLTDRVPGRGFTQTSSIVNTSGGAAPTLTTATTTANSGPDCFDVPANWSPAAVPVDSDTAVIEGAFNIRRGLSNSSISPARVIVRDFSGTIGLPPTNAEGGYPEYRTQELTLGNVGDGVTTTWDVMQNVTSQLIRINGGTGQIVANIYSTGTPLVPTVPALTIRGTHASNVLNVLGGNVGSATESGEAATWATCNVAGGGAGGPTVELGLGLTLATLNVDGGTVYLYSDATTVVVNGGTLYLQDDPDIGTSLTVNGPGTVYVNGGPTIAAMIVGPGARLLLDTDARTFAVTHCTLGFNGTIHDPFSRVTWTNGVVYSSGVGNTDVDFDFGKGRTVTVS